MICTLFAVPNIVLNIAPSLILGKWPLSEALVCRLICRLFTAYLSLQHWGEVLLHTVWNIDRKTADVRTGKVSKHQREGGNRIL